jgi:hypothetical protein
MNKFLIIRRIHRVNTNENELRMNQRCVVALHSTIAYRLQRETNIDQLIQRKYAFDMTHMFFRRIRDNDSSIKHCDDSFRFVCVVQFVKLHLSFRITFRCAY